MDVVMGNNRNVAHEVRRYVASGFVPDVKSGFIPTSPGNVADKLRRYEKTKPVASGLSPTTPKWDPSRRPSAKIGEGGRSRR